MADGLASTAVASFVFAWPKEALPEGIHSWAIGNHASCSVAGFCYILFGTVASFYHCCIAIHFWAIVRGERRTPLSLSTCLTPAQRRKVPLIIAHVTSISIPLALSVAGAITNSYYPRIYPMICYLDIQPDKSDTAEPIDRTTPGAILRILRHLITISLGLVSISCTIALYCRVRFQLKQTHQRHTSRNLRFSSNSQPMQTLRSSTTSLRNSLRNLRSSASSQPNNNTLGTETPEHATIHAPSASDQRFRRRLRAVAGQAFWYLLAYLNSFVILLIGWMVAQLGEDITGREGDPGPFVLQLVILCSVPFQGALTFIVFVRPRYQAWRAWLQKNQERLDEQDEGPATVPSKHHFCQCSLVWEAFQKSIWEEMPSPQRQRGQLQLNHSNSNPQEQLSAVEAAWDRHQTNSKSLGLLLSLEHDLDDPFEGSPSSVSENDVETHDPSAASSVESSRIELEATSTAEVQ